jgi:DNA-binding response OmpR family regulator
VLRTADVELNRLDRRVVRGGCPVELTNKEFSLLEYLLLHRGHCISRVELLESIWKLEPAQTTNIVDVYVNYLRRKLRDTPPGSIVRTLRGQGYMVAAETAPAIEPPGFVVSDAPLLSTQA